MYLITFNADIAYGAMIALQFIGNIYLADQAVFPSIGIIFILKDNTWVD